LEAGGTSSYPVDCVFQHLQEHDHALFGPLAAIGCTAMTKMTRPAKIIILRHAEKQNKHELSDLGLRRAKALAKQFLGSKSNPALLRSSERPAAVLAITAHTIETAKPAAKTWGLKTKAARIPGRDKGNEKNRDLDKATKHAARDVLTNPAYAGKTVIMVWEHKHIASKKNNAAQTSLRALLHLDQATPPPPKKWKSDNYNFFWVVTYGPGKRVKVDTSQRQAFTGKFADLPNNDWGEPENPNGK
jgi:hypothetical protein